MRAGRDPRVGPRRRAVAAPRPRARPAHGSAPRTPTRPADPRRPRSRASTVRANRPGRPERRARPPPASGFASRSEGRRTGVWVRSNSRPTPAVLQRSAVAHQPAMRGVRQPYFASVVQSCAKVPSALCDPPRTASPRRATAAARKVPAGRFGCSRDLALSDARADFDPDFWAVRREGTPMRPATRASAA